MSEINDQFNCNYNELTSLEHCPKLIKGNFSCSNNKLTSLKGCPEIINIDFYCSNNELTSLEYCPKVIKGNFNCNDNKITSLKYFPLKIEGQSLEINNNYLKEEELINFNCDVKNVKNIYSDFNQKGNVEDFLKKLNYYKIKKENKLLKEINNTSYRKLNKKL